jgi:hypothetical protein
MGAYDSFLSRIPNVDDEQETNPELAKRLEQAQLAYKEKFGKDLPVTSKVRTRKEQQDLYDRYQKGEKGIYMPINPSKEPNKEIFHTDAVDIDSNVPESFLNQFGIHRPHGKRDPVHAVLDLNFKSTETPTSFLSRIPSEDQAQEIQNEPEQAQEEYRPGFYNPNLAAQGERARRSGGGNLQPIVEGVTGALKSMSLEDWKKESTLANMLKYGVGQMPIVGDQEFYEEGKNKLIESGKSAINALMNPIQTYEAISQIEPGELLGQMVKGGIYDLPLGPSAKPIMTAAGAVAKPVISAAGKVLTPVAEGFGTLQESFANAKKAVNPTVSIEPLEMTGVGAANVNKQSAIANLIPDLTPETQAFVNSHPSEKINLPALETKALEEKHGINLSKGQRVNDKSIYANEWNARDTNPDIQRKFSNQPTQFQESFERTLDKHAGDIGELTKENIGQLQINGLLEKDLLRQNAIKSAYKDLENANGGQLPIDVSQLNNNINSALAKKLKTNVYEDKLGTIKKDIDGLIKNGQMTFEDFENLRSNLADEMRTNTSGSARAAAHIIRDQLENLPFPENMQHLKPLADKARSLYKERMEVIKNNPAYKAAVKEAGTMEEAESGLTALNAAKFHDKYVTGATPEAVRRMMEELKDSPTAIKAIKAGDIINARDALVPNTGTPQLKPDMYNRYLRSQADKAKYVHDKESLQDLLDLGILSSKVAKPTENVFNFSNSYSAYLGDLLKEGIKMSGEGALAAKTGGLSVPVINAGKGFYSRYKSGKFAEETVHPHSGLIEENK